MQNKADVLYEASLTHITRCTSFQEDKESAKSMSQGKAGETTKSLQDIVKKVTYPDRLHQRTTLLTQEFLRI